MYIYYLLLILWAFAYMFIDSSTEPQQSKRKLAIFYFVTLALLMGLRDYSVGTDLLGYVNNHFLEATDTIPGDILERKEYGYQIYLIFLHKIGCTPRWFVFITSVFIAACFSYSLYRNCDNMFLAFFLHITFGMFPMTMSGMRQAIAMGIFLLVFELLKNKKILWALLLIFVASTFHRSVLITLPVFIMPYITLNKKTLYIIFVIVLSCFFVGPFIAPVIETFATDDYIDRYGVINTEYAINPLLVLMHIIVAGVSLKFMEQLKPKTDNKQNINYLILMSLLNSLFYILAFNNAAIVRLGFYFTTFNAIILTNIASTMNSKNRTLVYFLLIIFGLAIFTKSTIGGVLQIDHYLFFWE